MDTSWIENLIKATADAYSTVKSADAINHKQTANDGTTYTNGQFNTTGGISPTVLLLGGAVLLFVLIKD